MEDMTCHVFPSANPLAGKDGEDRRLAMVAIVGRVCSLLEGDLGAILQEKREGDGYLRFSVDPEAVALATGAEFPVREIEVMFSITGDPMRIPIYDADGVDGETPVSVSFGECFFFEESRPFFSELAAAFGSGRVVFGGTSI